MIDMRRREFIGALGGAAVAWPSGVHAQQTATERQRTVGVLFAGSGRGSVPDEAFRSGLRARGYIEGQNIRVEFRTAEGKCDRLPSLAAELVGAISSLATLCHSGRIARGSGAL